MLRIKNVTKTFGDVVALESISFDVEKGDFIFLVGPSGSGKTTLIKLILKELTPDTGEILLDKEDITKLPDEEIPYLRQRIGVVFQDFKVLPERTLRENIEVALAVAEVDPGEWVKRVEHVLDLVGLSDKIEMFPAQLSGGELQRASLARALVVNPDFVLADEPTGNLDWETAEEIINLLDKINKEGKTVIVATHHKAIVDKMDKRKVELKKPAKKGKKEKKTKKENG